ncbi:rhomboid family intramembrane serine protease, partial [candidate division KSB1 bacterium]|nr:rhomboid family intramembrane serine protease [candidate division KSB1 bacterium]
MYFKNYEIGFGSTLSPAVKNLLIANGAVFLLQFIGAASSSIFGLVPESVLKRGILWLLVPYMFMHGSFWPIFINMFVLYM